MTGLYNGIGITLLISFLTLILNPLFTVLLIKEMEIIKRLEGGKKIIVLILIFLLLAGIVFFLIRNYSYTSLDWLLAYLVGVGLLYLFFRIKRIRQASSHSQEKED